MRKIKITAELTPAEEGAITVPIPIHSNRPLKKGTLHNILKKTGLSREKLVFLLALLLH